MLPCKDKQVDREAPLAGEFQPIEPSIGRVDQSVSLSISEFAHGEVLVVPLLSALLTVVDNVYTESLSSMTL